MSGKPLFNRPGFRVGTRTPRVPQAAVMHFKAAMAGHARYWQCKRDEAPCLSPSASGHCESCAEHLDAVRKLQTSLGLEPAHPSPVDTDTDSRPEWCEPGDTWYASWREVRRLRLALEAAASE